MFHGDLGNRKILNSKTRGIKDGDGIRTSPFLPANYYFTKSSGNVSCAVDAVAYGYVNLS
jgi:hypothetical protein